MLSVGARTVHPQKTAAAVEAAKLKWAQRRHDTADTLGEIVDELLARVHVPAEPESVRDVKDLLLAAAIAIDKAQLLSGQVTDRRESIRPEVVEAELERLAAEVRDRAERHNGN